MPTRELYWNIDGHWLIYPLFLIAFGFIVYGYWKRIRLWKLGQPENRWRDVWAGIKDIFVYGIFHYRILKDKYPGIMHFLILWGFIFLGFATTIVALQADFGLNFFHGVLYVFIKLTANAFGLLAVVGLIMALWRRYVEKPDRLDNKKGAGDGFVLVLILAILITGFITEAVRIVANNDPWAAYGFVGYWISPLFSGMSAESLSAFHRFLWWFHLLLAFTFLGAIPYTKLTHILLAPANQFLRKRGPIGVPEKIDFEDESLETFGKSKLREFSWKTLFNSDACIRCGRCQDNCPAYLSGKHLNPKQVIQDMRDYMEEVGEAYGNYAKAHPAVAVAGAEGSEEAAAAVEAPSEEELGLRNLIGDVIPEEDLWACTTCRSCEQQCPIFVEHVDKTIDMRRNLVLMESRFPAEAQLAFKNMENNGNPWGIGWTKRAEHLTSLGVPTLEENPEPEILYWPGCSGAYDMRNQKVSSAFVKLLQKANVNFSIIGNEEKCCGDSARRLGNEYLFFSLATENIEVMNSHGIKKIVTQCPHCFNVLKQDYPEFGGNYEVIHHTQYLYELLKSGRLKLNKAENNPTITYHDSCYLGRYHQIYEEPRELLKAAGFTTLEMSRNHEKSFCCGAGGGRMWLEEKEGKRINEMRTDEALATHADFVGTACPFCLTMINDGIAAREAEEKVKAQDIAEILASRI
ncbi:heterodisulfide reductase-related iron-sulfur binding cluster [Desulfitobacterium sp.]|uniref:heterodisulfide reductase-related iron-sulfur binding cluster n=1 Tax=Desulfitobacterium sp. TaxID=49981 RepID=UPI002B203C0A|nr:heterodisulfide reductase-related iron-sulfur binding cluster [Desulfitobacterium sp.]MEA4902076.1 heterodisulfide reductase-related iron-sulfur binding cluster [Desulfitobacterium sp.]